MDGFTQGVVLRAPIIEHYEKWLFYRKTRWVYKYRSIILQTNIHFLYAVCACVVLVYRFTLLATAVLREEVSHDTII